MTYTVKHTTSYPGGHAKDPGYRSTTVLSADRLREYHFTSNPDGSDVRSICTRRASVGSGFRAINAKSAAKRAPDLETAIKAYLDREEGHAAGARAMSEEMCGPL